jgi:hypothetical protein
MFTFIVSLLMFVSKHKGKLRKLDWNGVIIKELRKVFKRHHMKPLKMPPGDGLKERNAPWKQWFDEAYKRGVHTELPPDILNKAIARFSKAYTGILYISSQQLVPYSIHSFLS